MGPVSDPSLQPASFAPGARGPSAPGVQGPPSAPAQRPPLYVMFPASAAITAAVLVFYLLETLLGGPEQSVLRLGAVRHDLVLEDGQYFRLFCAAFLHGHLLHLGLNGLALIQLAPLVELLWGSSRMLAVYLLSAVGGTLASAVFLPVPSVGASGAILGLAGLLIGATWIAREPFRTRLRQVLGQRLLFGVLLTFALGLGLQLSGQPIVDNYGHLGGFAVGLVASLFLREPAAPAGRVVRGLSKLLVALCLGAFGWMAVAPPPESLERLMAFHARIQREAPEMSRGGDLTRALASELAAAGRIDDARAVLLVRLSAAPGDVDVLGALARSYRLHGGVSPDALAVARAAAERAAATQELEEPLAREALLRATAELHGLAGDADAARRVEDEHLALLERELAADPGDPGLLNALAWALVSRHDPAARDPARAERLARQAIDALETSLDRFTFEGKVSLAMTRDTLAEALRQLGRLPEAEAFQRTAVDLARGLGLGGEDLLELTQRLEKIQAARR